MRHGWLKKAINELSNNAELNKVNIFSADDSIAKFGVGKNMVESMGYWATACDVIEDNKQVVKPLGEYIFCSETGVDQYLEDEATLWLLHWQLTKSLAPCTTWHFGFHHFSRAAFEREQLENAVRDYAIEREDREPNRNTLSKDIDCFINCYATRRNKRGEINEETLDCPLTELDLIAETAVKGTYQFNIGPKDTLPDPIFLYCLLDYFQRKNLGTSVGGKSPKAATLSIENILYEPGSPGRAFKLDEGSLTERLVRIGETSQGICEWIDTAGLRQVQILNPSPDDLWAILDTYYRQNNSVERVA